MTPICPNQLPLSIRGTQGNCTNGRPLTICLNIQMLKLYQVSYSYKYAVMMSWIARFRFRILERLPVLAGTSPSL